MKLRSGRVIEEDSEDAVSPITSCGDCITCKKGFLSTDQFYENKVSGQQYTVTEELNCKTKGVIYLIRCAAPNCCLQYIGQTVNSVNTRCIQHRSGLLSGNEPKFVREHFTKTHNISDLRITPLESVKITEEEDDTTQKKRKRIVEKLREVENNAILQLATLFPYGLNDRLEKPIYMDAEDQHLQGASIYKIFPKITTTRKMRGSRKKREEKRNTESAENSFEEIETAFLDGNLHQCRTIICSLSSKTVIELGALANSKIINSVGMRKVLVLIVLDLCKHYKTRNTSYKDFVTGKYSNRDSNKKDTKYLDYVPLKFISKELEDIDFNSILNSYRSVFPSKFLNAKFKNEDFRFVSCFKYERSIRGDISNYKSVVLDGSSDDRYECFCHLYPEFINKDCGHVVSGDMRIVSNRKLRKLFQKGMGFIESTYKNHITIINRLSKDIDNYITKLSCKYSVNVRYFDEWKDSVCSDIKSKLLNIRLKRKRYRTVLKSESRDLDILKNRFVLTGIDKASNNVSIICKKFYAETIEKELENTKTYIPVAMNESEVVSNHVKFCRKFDIEVTNDHFKLPFIHMLPKFHKPKLDFRYIAAGVKSSTKCLAKILSSVLTLIDNDCKRLDKYRFKFKGTAGYWVVKNKTEVVSKLNYLNRSRSANTVTSFDFKKLYTNLPHDQVIDRISLLIKKCFEDRGVQYIKISDSFKANWTSVLKHKWTFNEEQLIEMFSFLMNNIYVNFRGRVYKQVIGIPMGCDCAPKVADLFLYSYESDFIASRVENGRDVFILNILKYSSRYIDDLNVPNATSEICKVIREDIYPKELTIELTNVDDLASASFLDIDISVDNNRFHTKLYDKRRDFAFNVVSFANLKSNIPNKAAYGTFVGELYRIARSSSDISALTSDVKLLISKLVRQNFNQNVLFHKLANFIRSFPACINKFWRVLKVTDFY